MITTLEKSIKDIKAENVQMSETINNISVEFKKLKEIFEELKRAQPNYTAPPISQPFTRSSQAIPKQKKEISSESEEVEESYIDSESDIPKMFQCKKCDFEDKGSHNVSTHNLKTHWKYNNDRFEC
jgi:hypothetical protein